MNDVAGTATDGRAIANFVLDYCDSAKRPVSNLSLQKIVYFCHVWSLTSLGRPLIRRGFEAWQHGPVVQYLYREFKEFDDRPITTRARKIDPFTGKRVIVSYKFDEATTEFLQRVVAFYSQLSAFDLVALTHVQGGPWEAVWYHGGRVNPGMKICDGEIARFYSSIRAPFVAQ